MAKPKQEINPKCKFRLHQLCDELGITQKQLAIVSEVSENTISKIATGKSPITQAIARQIISKYPSYRIEWLMGLDDYPHEVTNWRSSPLAKVAYCCAVADFLKRQGIEAGQITASGYFHTSEGIWFSPNIEVELRKGQETIWRGRSKELEAVMLEIYEFAEFKINRLCSRWEGQNHGID